MKDEFLNEILYSVFVSDRDAFIKFIQSEISFSFRFKKEETEFLLWVIEDQLRYVLKKREDATHASPKIVDLLNELKKSSKD